MTWTETHERMRIIREVQDVSAADMTGAIPWRDDWSAYFDGPGALVEALRARWTQIEAAQLDPLTTDEAQLDADYVRLHHSQRGVLAILDGRTSDAQRVLHLTDPAAPAAPAVRRWHFRVLRGPVMPTSTGHR